MGLEICMLLGVHPTVMCDEDVLGLVILSPSPYITIKVIFYYLVYNFLVIMVI